MYRSTVVFSFGDTEYFSELLNLGFNLCPFRMVSLSICVLLSNDGANSESTWEGEAFLPLFRISY
jgi:hypothetical protein